MHSSVFLETLSSVNNIIYVLNVILNKLHLKIFFLECIISYLSLMFLIAFDVTSLQPAWILVVKYYKNVKILYEQEKLLLLLK